MTLTANLQTTREVLGWPTIAVYAAAVAASLPIWPFGWHLAVHVLGAVMLVGNALVMAVWLTLVGFAGSDQAKRQAARSVNLGDAWFTVPGVVLLVLNGLAMVAARYGGVMALASTGWITIGLILLGVSGLIWALRLLPAQLALYRLAQASGPLDAAVFRAILNRWFVWGVIATALPLLAVFVMTTKLAF